MLIDGKPMPGMWYDRAVEYEVNRQAEGKAARNSTPVETVKGGDFMTPYELKLAPLPLRGDPMKKWPASSQSPDGRPGAPDLRRGLIQAAERLRLSGGGSRPSRGDCYVRSASLSNRQVTRLS